MVRFNVRPSMTVHSNNDVRAACHVTFDHGPNQVDVRVADSMVKNGNFTTDGLVVALRNGQGLELEYDVGRQSPLLRMRSSLVVGERVVDLRYHHSFRTNKSRLQLRHQVDANNVAKVDYEAVGWEGPSHRPLTLRWSYRQGDFTIEPAFNLGTESAALTARYRVDADNYLRARVDAGTNMGELAWRHTGTFGGEGDFRVVARTSLERGATWTKPSLVVEKTWVVDK